METRLDTFNGWQMRATVESRLTTTGHSKYFIVQPVAYKEFSTAEPMHPAAKGHSDGPFENADDAFRAAFGDCRRAIAHTIKSRNLESFS